MSPFQHNLLEFPTEELGSIRKKYYNQQPRLSSSYKIKVLSSITASNIDPYLSYYFENVGFSLFIEHAPYNQIIQTCLFLIDQPDDSANIILILWRVEDLLPTFQSFEHKSSLENIYSLYRAVDQLAKKTAAKIVISIPPIPNFSHISILNPLYQSQIYKLHEQVKNIMSDLCDNHSNVMLIDLHLLQCYNGIKQSIETRTWYLYKQPWTEQFWALIALQFTRLVKTNAIPPLKCLALDCDGVLWGGIIGEDGISNVQLNNDYPGIIFKEVQRYYQLLSNQGIFITLLSKNNESDVLEIFNQHNDMILKIDDIATHQINWDEKHNNIKKIAENLNIGLDSIVFIDDNPFEVKQMQYHCPEVYSILRPTDLLQYLETIKSNTLFDRYHLTTEDVERKKMITNESKRQENAKKLTTTDFLQSLNLYLTFGAYNLTHLNRIVQLFQKTNQFNLSTKRYSTEQIIALSKQDNCYIFTLSAEDTFGNYGLIGVAIVFVESNKMILDSFLLSCRILGKEVEIAFLRLIFDNIQKNNIINGCEACYIATEKNLPIKNFLQQVGFHKKKNHNYLTIDKENIPLLPTHIKIIFEKTNGNTADHLNPLNYYNSAEETK